MRVLLAVDNGTNRASSAAFHQCLKDLDKTQDILYLVNVYSSWDYLNEERNAGKLALAQYQRLCETEGIKSLAKQRKADSPNEELVEIIKELNIDTVYIGSLAFTSVANADNVVFNLFSNVKRYFVGTTAEYLTNNCPQCNIVTVAAKDDIR